MAHHRSGRFAVHHPAAGEPVRPAEPRLRQRLHGGVGGRGGRRAVRGRIDLRQPAVRGHAHPVRDRPGAVDRQPDGADRVLPVPLHRAWRGDRGRAAGARPARHRGRRRREAVHHDDRHGRHLPVHGRAEQHRGRVGDAVAPAGVGCGRYLAGPRRRGHRHRRLVPGARGAGGRPGGGRGRPGAGRVERARAACQWCGAPRWCGCAGGSSVPGDGIRQHRRGACRAPRRRRGRPRHRYLLVHPSSAGRGGDGPDRHRGHGTCAGDVRVHRHRPCPRPESRGVRHHLRRAAGGGRGHGHGWVRRPGCGHGVREREERARADPGGHAGGDHARPGHRCLSGGGAAAASHRHGRGERGGAAVFGELHGAGDRGGAGGDHRAARRGAPTPGGHRLGLDGRRGRRCPAGDRVRAEHLPRTHGHRARGLHRGGPARRRRGLYVHPAGAARHGHGAGHRVRRFCRGAVHHGSGGGDARTEQPSAGRGPRPGAPAPDRHDGERCGRGLGRPGAAASDVLRRCRWLPRPIARHGLTRRRWCVPGRRHRSSRRRARRGAGRGRCRR